MKISASRDVRDPDTDPGKKRFYLSDIRWKYKDCRLILAGTCDDLIHPFTGELADYTFLFES